MSIDFIEVENGHESFTLEPKKMIIFEKFAKMSIFEFFRDLKKNEEKPVILKKSKSFSVTRRAGCLIPTRRVIRCSGKSSAGGSAT